MKSLFPLLLLLVSTLVVNAQTARVQIIHNSPSPTVDIYAGDDLLLDNFVFRTATPFIDVPADVEIPIGVALSNSTSSADAIATFPVTFEADKTYVVVAAGVVGDADTPFSLYAFDMAAETASSDENIGLLFFHGSPDAPEVDIATGGIPIFDNVSFGGFSGYIDVPASMYELDVTLADDNSAVVASYMASFNFWRGRTAVVFASGFLGSDPSFEPWVALDNGGTFPLPALDIDPPVEDTIAKVQIIHNSPSAGADTVDIYANGEILLDDFAFQTATPFVEVPAGVVIEIAVAPGNSTSVADAIATFPVTFEEGTRYIAVANGLVGGDPAFTIDIFDMGREAANDAGNFDLAVLHGSPDAPPVDIAARGIGTVVPNIAFGEFADYLELIPDTYFLDIKPAGSDDIVATFEADVSGLAGLSGIAIASGLLGGDPAFGIIVVLADGTVVSLPTASFARVQIIHNSPSPTVDIYVNDDLAVDNFAFRTATPFISLPAGVELFVGVALDNSQSSADAIATFPLTLENGNTYVVVANGIVGGDPGFGLEVFDMGQETASADDQVGLLFFHGSPDAPEVDILANGGVLFDDVEFGEFQGYANVPAAAYTIGVTPGNDNNTIVAEYDADFSFWSSRTAVVFASGFLSGGTPGFEPWVALDNGGTFPLSLAMALQSDNPVALTTNGSNGSFNVFPNPASDGINMRFDLNQEGNLTLEIYNFNGQMVAAQNYGEQEKGQLNLKYNISELNSGMYFLQLRTADGLKTSKLNIIK
jgi:hypothetical protein